MTQQLYRVTLIDGSTIEGLTYDEANEYFYGYAGSSVQPWPVQEYVPPGAQK